MSRSYFDEITNKEESGSVLGNNQVFIVHGHDSKAKLELARLLEKDFKLIALILHEQSNKGNTIIEKLERVSEYPGYVFVVLTPDDLGCESSNNHEFEPRPRARQNVILELGYFLGRLGRNKVCCLYKSNVEIPSDINGVLYLPFKESVTECYQDIMRELRSANVIS